MQSKQMSKANNPGYTGDVLQQAQALADHAARPGPGKIEKEDVELAIQLRRRHEFVEAPPRDVSCISYHEPAIE